MKCPIDGTTLVMAERQGVEIDYCPECRGVWLDRGELDKIIERSVPPPAPPPPPPRGTDARDAAEGRGRRRGSFLDDIFDF
jgi:Zn-finger nucleic acid-binding protein